MSSTPSTSRRKPPVQRRAEIVAAAGSVAIGEGLEKVTAKRVATELGVYPGLVNHYFRTADELVAAAFEHAAGSERDEVYGYALAAASATERIRRLLGMWLAQDRDAVSLLWLDAWQAGRRRPALNAVVVDQMQVDLDRLAPVIEAGMADGSFTSTSATDVAQQIIALIDGTSVRAAVRDAFDYSSVEAMVLTTVAGLLGISAASLRG